MLSRLSARTYSTAASQIKTVVKDSAGSLTKLTVEVNNAGSKASKSGVAHLLSKFNFLNTEGKSALRFTRESELLGGVFSSEVTRDSILLKAEFLKENLPFYVEELGNVLAKTSFRPHELKETVIPTALAEYAEADNSYNKAVESLHELSFRKGLGQPLYYDGLSTITIDEVKEFASSVYNSSNITLYATGADEADLNTFIQESALSTLPVGVSVSTPVEIFTDKESRFRAAGVNVAAISIPVKPEDFYSAVALSSAAALAKIPGASSYLYRYKDAGLLVASVAHPDAAVVAKGIKDVKKALSAVTTDDLTKALESAKLSFALESSFDHPLSVAPFSKKSINVDKFNYSAVGDLDVLPYANEL